MPVRVMKHNDAGVRVRLEGGPGLFGFVPADYVTDDVLPIDPITGQVCVCVCVCFCLVFCSLYLAWLWLCYRNCADRFFLFTCPLFGDVFFFFAVGMLVDRSM